MRILLIMAMAVGVGACTQVVRGWIIEGEDCARIRIEANKSDRQLDPAL